MTTKQVEAAELYDSIGMTYSEIRRTDHRLAERIWTALGDAVSIVNVGAGSGSYEPPDRAVIAVEPSAVMRAQRPSSAAPCISASAERLPFPDKSFDAAMAVLSDHHWRDPMAGLHEMRRVARRVVLFRWDNARAARSWLINDYLPEFARHAHRGPNLAERARLLGARIETVPVPWDCRDGFLHAHWRRPEAYLRENIRHGTSAWFRVGDEAETRAVNNLAADLASGVWYDRNSELLELAEIDIGARLLISG